MAAFLKFVPPPFDHMDCVENKPVAYLRKVWTKVIWQAGSQAIAKTSIALSSLPGPGVHQRHLLRLIALPPLYQLVSTVHALDMFSLTALCNSWTPKQLFQLFYS